MLGANQTRQMNQSKNATPLQKYLFYKGQVYFQILAVAALVVGTIVLRSVFSFYQLPDHLFKIIFLVGFSLTILVIGLQAYLHHYIVSRGISPVSWLCQELKTSLLKLNRHTSSQPANIPDFEKEVKEVLVALEQRKEQYQEVKDLAETLENLIDLLRSYWQAATRNEVLVAIGRLSSEVAHDLKGPLSSLKVALDHIKNAEGNTQEFQTHLNILELSSHRLMGVANNLLAKYRGEKEEKSVFSIQEVLDELVGEHSYQAQYGAVKFIKNYHAENLYGEGNRHAIQRVFGNLIKNGAEAMQFVGKIDLETRLENQHIIVKVSDTGCGIPKNKLAKVFGDFSEGKEKGHGIGLQFVKKTVMAHGGEVWVESTFGEGAQFFVRLPSAPLQASLVPHFTLLCRTEEPIIVIDDDPSALEQWRLVLKDLGAPVNTFPSYESFEQDSKGSAHATAIVDYHFDNSELDGLEIIAKLRKQGFKNLYLCTAEYWKPSLKKQAEELGVMVCPKPLPKIVIKNDPTPLLLSSPLGGEGKGEGYNVLVIDDDRSIRLCWEVIQTKLHIEQLHLYPNLEALLEAKLDLSAVDIAFVDKNIENSKYSGAEVLNYLKSEGVSKVVLASGENEEELREDPQFSQADFITSEKIPSSFKEFFS